MWWWPFARAFWFQQQRLSVQRLLDAVLCSGELPCSLLSLVATNVPLHGAPSTIKMCQHILVLHTEKWQTYNETQARRRAVQ